MHHKILPFEILAGISLALSRILTGCAIMLLTIASYGWWGNNSSPLIGLWQVAAVVLVVSFLVWVGHCLALRKVKRLHRKYRGELIQQETRDA